MTLKQRIVTILKTTPLNISQTKRMGESGLRNADEVADLIIAELTEMEAKLVENLEDMCSAYKALCQLQKVDYYLNESSRYAKAQNALSELNKE